MTRIQKENFHQFSRSDNAFRHCQLGAIQEIANSWVFIIDSENHYQLTIFSLIKD
ncbi:hypothetical protein [Bacillus massiliglaciei]|uniref:hypothetical protein n=1 Tax=Bacillus massiliglaciei TaxID=1816693 RepID=UPI0018FE4F05|nr:hypothetical protein [Bacillus massiliglaciei]